MRRTLRLTLFCTALACLALAWLAVTASTASAAERLRALIVDGQNNHPWAKTTPILKKVLEESGRFSVDVATSPAKGEDMAGFKPDFAKYDVVVSNYNGAAWPTDL